MGLPGAIFLLRYPVVTFLFRSCRRAVLGDSWSQCKLPQRPDFLGVVLLSRA